MALPVPPSPANDETASAVARAISRTLDGRPPLAGLVARALLSELGAAGEAEDAPEAALLLPLEIAAPQLAAYRRIGSALETAGRTAHAIEGALVELSRLKLRLSLNYLRKEGKLGSRILKPVSFQMFDIVELRDAGRDPEEVWLVRSGQWAFWFLNARTRLALSRIARAALASPEADVADLTLKLGEYIAFHLTVGLRQPELTVPLFNVLSFVCDAQAFDSLSGPSSAVVLRRFQKAAEALERERVVTIRLSQADLGPSGIVDAPQLHGGISGASLTIRPEITVEA